VPYYFEKVSQVAIPTSNTSEVEKQILIVISAFNRLVQNCVDSVELKNLQGAFPGGLAQWMVQAYDTIGDKSFKKVIALEFKSIII
jgi:hypothetical protein